MQNLAQVGQGEVEAPPEDYNGEQRFESNLAQFRDDVEEQE